MAEQPPPGVSDPIAAHGYTVIEDFDQDQLLAVARLLGIPYGDSRNRTLVRDLHPRASEESPANTLSSRYGTGAFPLHTETAYWRTPARYVLLYCVSPGKGDRPTLLMDLTPKIGPPESADLATELWVVGRMRHPFLAPVLESAGSPRLRFDPECMRPSRHATKTPGILERLLAEDSVVSVEWRRKDLLVIDNYRMLHGRGIGHAPDPDRHLQRVLVQEREVS